jgi:phytoene desaturase
MSTVAIIGSGFSALSAASYLAKMGYSVDVYEKNGQVGGRARVFNDSGFTFDMGPSWYWMPEVFEDFFKDFGCTVSDFYDLVRLDPSYQVIYKEESLLVPSLRPRFESFAREIDPNSGEKLSQFLDEAEIKYKTAMAGFVEKPSLSIAEFAKPQYLSQAAKLDMFKPVSKSVAKVSDNPKLKEILEFPVLFLGDTPKRIPALYTMMNHADIALGTWYPMGGMYKVIEGFEKVARAQGVRIHTNSPVTSIRVNADKKASIVVNDEEISADIVLSGADYHHTEQHLLEKAERKYSKAYWNKRDMAPSCLIYYLGIDREIPGLEHHNLFFDADFSQHSEEIYTDHKWPEDPLFYICCPSKTDDSVAPKGKENLFVLIPVSTELEDTEEVREKYLSLVIKRLQKKVGIDISNHIEVKHAYARSNFIQDYNAFKGNAYGLSNTLRQTAFLKPKMCHKKIKNLYFTGQLTVPGPGVPPSIISGRIVSKLIKTQHPK